MLLIELQLIRFYSLLLFNYFNYYDINFLPGNKVNFLIIFYNYYNFTFLKNISINIIIVINIEYDYIYNKNF